MDDPPVSHCFCSRQNFSQSVASCFEAQRHVIITVETLKSCTSKSDSMIKKLFAHLETRIWSVEREFEKERKSRFVSLKESFIFCN